MTCWGFYGIASSAFTCHLVMDFNASPKRNIGGSSALLLLYNNTDFTPCSIENTHSNTLFFSMSRPCSVPHAKFTMMLWATTLALALLSLSKSNIFDIGSHANGKGATSTNFVAASNNSRVASGACVYIRNSNCQKSKKNLNDTSTWLDYKTASRLTIDLTRGFHYILWHDIVIWSGRVMLYDCSK
jgi:hypothetical protein